MTATEQLTPAPRGRVLDHPEPATAAHQALAAEALALATTRPTHALEVARDAEELARRAADWSCVSLAQRAAGVAATQLRDHDLAIERLRAAVSTGRRSSDLLAVGEAQICLSSALVLRGRLKEGLAAVEEALTNLTGLPAARARSQRAALFIELGRLDQALDDLRVALPWIRRGGDAALEARLLSNRALVFRARRQLGAARADLLRAQELFDSAGSTLLAGYVEQNLGCLDSDLGDIPSALQHFDRAGERYESLGVQVGSLQVDRARVLLSVRLVAEARDASERAVAIHLDQRRQVHLPESQLMLSTVALLQGDLRTAVSAAKEAVRTFGRQGRHEWAALARYAALQAQVSAAAETPGPAAGLVRRLAAVAAELDEVGWVVPALGARVLAGQLALLEGRPRAAREQLLHAARARRSGPADSRSRAWYAEALLREAEGNRRGAKAALRAGVRVVEDYRATLGATELRAHVSVHRGVIARTGLRLALEDRDPRAAMWWAEHGRASALLTRPVRPPQDEVLARHVQDLRATMSELEAARSSGAASSALVSAQVRTEQAIRDHCRHYAPDGTPAHTPHPRPAELAERLGETALVEYVELDGHLHAITLVDGRARLRALGPAEAVRHSVTHLPFALHRLASPATRSSQLAAASEVLARTVARLQEVLLAPLEKELAHRPLLVVPVGWLQSVPWSLLPACAGRPVSVAPSAALWFGASRRQARPGGGVVAVAGPRLPGAVAEADAVGALYPGSTVLKDEHATAAAVAAAFEGAQVAHVAAHGTVRADNALFSSLLLADGPYTAYDLERLAATPHHVVLAACNSALAHVTAGEEVLGLSATLLAQETAVLVAPVVAVPDVETVALMTTYHRLLVRGQTPASALALAQQQHGADGVRATACSAGFVCLGAGDVALDAAAAGSVVPRLPAD